MDVSVSSGEGFAALGLSQKLVERLEGLGYSAPTEIQSRAIPHILQGRDVTGQAATGTGKTAAYMLPIIDRIVTSAGAQQRRERAPVALVLVPTRELATQVCTAAQSYSQSVRVLPIFGGQPYGIQLRGLDRGVDIVVATPGRALDHIQRGTLNLGSISTLVLDEADEMLAMGFVEDIEKVIESVPEGRQLALFSATMPPRIAAIARQHLQDPVDIFIQKARLAEGDIAPVKQLAFVVPRHEKLAALKRVIAFEEPTAAIIFCRTRTETDEVAAFLNTGGIAAEALHGGMSQDQRERVMNRLRDETLRIVVATDIAARGLDIDHLSHVFNFDVPSSPETYVHRVGRVGRAGRTGTAITMAEPRHRTFMRILERVVRQPIWPSELPTAAAIESRRLLALSEQIKKVLSDDSLDLGVWRMAATALTSSDPAVDVHDLLAAAMLVSGGAQAMQAAQKSVQKSLRKSSNPSFQSSQGESRGDESRSGMGVLRVGGGRQLGVTPRDLVGAITGEAGIEGRAIGSIKLEDKFALVEIRADLIDRVEEVLQNLTLLGQNVMVSREQGVTRLVSAPRQDRPAAIRGDLDGQGRRSGRRPRDGRFSNARRPDFPRRERRP
jgi:ATP-dependent RNA helicase DeaD